MASTAAVLNILVDANTGVATSKLSALNAELKGTEARASKTSGALGSKFGKASKAAAIGVAAIGVAAAAAGKALYDVGSEFDDAFDTIRARTGATGKHLKRLEGDFKNVVSSVPADFDDAAEAVSGLASRLDISGKPLRQLSKQFLELSRITGEDVKGDVKTVTRAFGDWAVATKKQSGVLDEFYRASQKSGASVEDLADLVVKFGSPLRQAGFGMDEAIAMFASFEKAGVNIQTMLPGLKQALKNFLEEDRDPHKALQETFRGIEDGTIKASKALEIFGTRAGADMVEAVEQGRFHLASFQKQIENGDATIRKTGKQTMDASENFKLLANRLKVLVEPAASAVFNLLGDFSAELAQFNFRNPISGSVAFALALGGTVTAIGLAVKALAALRLAALSNPWTALALGIGLVVGALIGMRGHTEKAIPTFKKAENTLSALRRHNQQLHDAQQRVSAATRNQKQAEQQLQEARKKHGPNSTEAIKAEARYRGAINRTSDAIERQKRLERISKVERHAAMAVLRVDVARLASQEGKAVAVREGEARGLKGIFRLYKRHQATLGEVRERIAQYSAASKTADDKSKHLNEVIAKAGKEIGPHYAGTLEKIAGKTRRLYKESGSLAERISDMPKREVINFIADLKIGKVQGPMGKARGGSISMGAPSGDSVPAMLERGEYVLNRKAVDAVGGPSVLDNLNFNQAPRFATGGAVLKPLAHTPEKRFGEWTRRYIQAHLKSLAQLGGGGPSGPAPPGFQALYKMWNPGAPQWDVWQTGLLLQKLGFEVAENPHFGGVHPVHTADSYHYSGRAIDFNWPGGGGGELAKLQSVYGALSKLHPKDPLIEDAGGSNQHGHFAFQRGGMAGGGRNLLSRMGGLPSWVHGSKTLSPDQLASLAHYVGMANPAFMGQIAMGESSGNPRAVNHNSDGSTDYGLWQINSVHGYSPSKLFDPLYNARAAAEVLSSSGVGAWYASPTGPKGHVSPLRGGKGASAVGGRSPHKEAIKIGLSKAKIAAGIAPGKALTVGGLSGSVPSAASGLPSSIQHLLSMPGLGFEGQMGLANLALEQSKGTEGISDDLVALAFKESLLTGQRGHIVKKLKGINKKLGKPGLKAKTQKKLLARREGLTSNLVGVEGELGGIAAERSATEEESKKAAEDLAAELKGLKEEMKRQTDYAERAQGTSNAVAWGALADILAGNLGAKTNRRSNTAGAGTTARY